MKENVLATEMRWKPINTLSRSATRDKSVVPNLAPTLTSASDLTAPPVFHFKMSYQGTVSTSISQCALGNTLADTLRGQRSSSNWMRLHFKCCLLWNIFFGILFRLIWDFFQCLRVYNEGGKKKIILNPRWLLSDVFLPLLLPTIRDWREKCGLSRSSSTMAAGRRQTRKRLLTQAVTGRESEGRLRFSLSLWGV